jgi:hypothetical protein
MQIRQVTFVKESDVPQKVTNTEFQHVASAIAEALGRCPAGGALAIPMDELKKHVRYALQRRLMKMGHSVRVTHDLNKNTLFVRKVAPTSAKPPAKK